MSSSTRSILSEAKNPSSMAASYPPTPTKHHPDPLAPLNELDAELAAATKQHIQDALETASILLPRVLCLRELFKANPRTTLASQDLGLIRYLLATLADHPELAVRHASAREVALDVLRARCKELARLAQENPGYAPSPVDMGILRTRNKITEAHVESLNARMRAIVEEQRARKKAEQQADEADAILAQTPAGKYDPDTDDLLDEESEDSDNCGIADASCLPHPDQTEEWDPDLSEAGLAKARQAKAAKAARLSPSLPPAQANQRSTPAHQGAPARG